MSEDRVDHPRHYGVNPSGVECIDVVEHMTFNRGNAVEYIWRAGEKDPATEIEDLRKAIWYLNREIERLGSVESNVHTAPGPVSNTYTLSPVYTDG